VTIANKTDTRTHRMYKHRVCVRECGITGTPCTPNSRVYAFYVTHASLIMMDDIDG